MKLVNNTHYYSINNKVFNVIPDSDSWQFQSNKRLSYSQRLYWEYKYIKSVGGQAFFYTFTYNEKSLPHFTYKKVDFKTGQEYDFRIPCFSYEHIRLITNGIISKILRRKYGSQLRYFVACERGEGKGKRGKGQNPHYHVIFFVSPLRDEVRKPTDVPYKRISPIQFCHLCKCVWQYQSSPNKYDHLVADYKFAKFGHCEPGMDLGLVTDFDALSYVSKYVVKDTMQTSDDMSVKEYYRRYFTQLGVTFHTLYNFYLYLRYTGAIASRQCFLEYSGLNKYFGWRSLTGRRDVSFYKWLSIHDSEDFTAFLKELNRYFKEVYLPNIIDSFYRDYANKFGSKVRTSKSLGIYGLNFVQDITACPHFVIDKSGEVATQPICLYYYRKLFMNVVRCPETGNPLYVLNDAGVDLKCRLLKNNIDSLKRKIYECFDACQVNSSNLKFLSYLSSNDVSISDYQSLISQRHFSDVIERFAVYRLVYQYRHYYKFHEHDLPFISYGFTYPNILIDYRKFLRSNFYTCDYSDLTLLNMFEVRSSDTFVSFDSHHSFSSYISYFRILEKLLDAYRDFDGDIKKKNFEDSTVLRQRLNAVKYSFVK